jgi:hypothetical protein
MNFCKKQTFVEKNITLNHNIGLSRKLSKVADFRTSFRTFFLTKSVERCRFFRLDFALTEKGSREREEFAPSGKKVGADLKKLGRI